MPHKPIIEEIIDIGYNILAELDEEEPNLNKINALYEDRGNLIKKLDKIPINGIDEQSDEKKEASKKLFTRFQLVEKQLKKNLKKLSQSKDKEIRKLGLHKKAKSSYNKTGNSQRGLKRKIVDLKSNS